MSTAVRPAVAARLRGRSTLLAATALAAAVELLPALPTVLRVPVGLWLLIGSLTVLWYGAADRFVSTRDGRALLAVCLAVLSDIVAALVLNTVLPPLGMDRPLARLPLVAVSLLAVLATAAACPVPDRTDSPPSPFPSRRTDGGSQPCDSDDAASDGSPSGDGRLAGWVAGRWWTIPPGLAAVSGAGMVVLTLSVAGPIRLNNGLSGDVSTVALIADALLLVLLLRGRRRYPAAVLSYGVFLAAAGLLLLTSLRGWYITGHDIQREYEVFRLTANADRWTISAFRDPYNACLSITLLPTSLTRLTGVPGIWVFKILMPLLFALTPAAVYRSVRNRAPQIVALLSAVYFMAFPTFFTDMTFLARQEIAFLLVGCAMVVLTDGERPSRPRRVMFTVLLLGVVLSHYSTLYVIMGILALALCADLSWRLLSRITGRRTRSHAVSTAARPFVTWWMVVAATAGAVVWSGPATHTTGQIRSTLSVVAREVLGENTGSGSSDTSYSLVGGDLITAGRRLKAYRADTIRQTAQGRAAGDYLPLDVVDRYAAPAVQQSDMPLTALGQTLHARGLDVKGVNGLIRQSVARLLQLLLVLGLVVTSVARRKGFRPSRDQITLSVGAIGVMGLLTVLPELSVDYGVLRAFQQGLLFFAPFVAAGSLWICRWAGRRAVPLACVLAVFLFLDLSGVVPKLVGGYPAQLNLANAGQYYDLYYVHPEERSAIGWLQVRISENQRLDVQSEVQTDRFTFGRLQTLIRDRASNDIYPTLVGSRSYVFFGSTTARRGLATLFYRGDLVTYRYPVNLLDTAKNRIYSSEGAEIYR
jgi:uncharacterized membrane protein